VTAVILRTCLLWAVLVFPSSGFPQITRDVSRTDDQNALTEVPPVEIPFKLCGSHLIVVQGTLGDLERLNFLVDTGANPSAVDRRIAKKLGLQGSAGKLALFNQNTNVERVVLPSLRLGPIRATSLPGLVQDLSSVEKVLGIQIDAILGFDVLSLSSFSIDYKSKKIIFGHIEPSPAMIPLGIRPPTFTVQLQVQDEQIRLLVDTGAADLLLFECRLSGRLRELPTRGVKRSSNSTQSQFELREVSLPSVRLGETDFGLRKAFLLDDNTNCGRSFDGVVGPLSLGLKWIAFDFEHRTFSWER
jgi:predicted aspartyl protease